MKNDRKSMSVVAEILSQAATASDMMKLRIILQSMENRAIRNSNIRLANQISMFSSELHANELIHFGRGTKIN